MRLARILVPLLLALASPISAAPPRGQAAVTARPAAAPSASVAAARRQAWLDRFARGYFPGRSGQIFVVPREGTIITDKDPLYRFMHGSPWEYDTRIPLLFHGAAFVRAGRWNTPATQQDVAPTLGAILGAPVASTYTGHVLPNVFRPSAERPRIAVLMVLDGMRPDYFDRYADVMPVLTRMRREGAWFSEARSTVLPTVTGVGHATIGTGTDPRIHGITVNNLFNRVTGHSQQAYDKLDPRELMALTLADVWNLTTDGRAIIIGHGGAIRATAGLVGRGACIVNGRKVLAASYNATDAGWETNPDCYTLPDALKPLNGKKAWEAAGGTWMGHDIASPTKLRASAVFQRFEAEALLAVLDHEPIGADAITDLVMVNMKGPDYTGHAYGPHSAEIKATLAELDRQMASLLALLDRKAGPGRSVVAITADHGMPPEPANGQRVYPADIVDAIHKRFDPEGKAIVKYYEDAANNQIYIDTARLQSLGFTLKDVAAFLQAMPAFAAAFTEDDVWGAQSRLPALQQRVR
jgi:hypothetical protein